MKTRTTTRTTEITIEGVRSVVIEKTSQRRFSFCPTCARDIEFVTPEAAAASASVTARTIYRWLEDGRLHFIETPEGKLLICSQSVP